MLSKTGASGNCIHYLPSKQIKKVICVYIDALLLVDIYLGNPLKRLIV